MNIQELTEAASARALHVTELARSTSDRLHQTQDTLSHLESQLTHLEEVWKGLHKDRTEALQTLDSTLESQRTRLDTTVHTLTERHAHRVTEVSTAATRLQVELERHRTEQTGALEQLRGQAESLRGRLNERIERVKTGEIAHGELDSHLLEVLTGLRDNTEHSISAIRAGRSALSERVADLEATMAEAASSARQDMDRIQAEATSAGSQVKSAIDDLFGESESNLQRLLLTELLEFIGQQILQSKESTEFLKKVGLDRFEEVDGRFSDILETVDKFNDVFKKIEPILEVIDELC